MRTFNLFISHSWTYSEPYDRLVRLLDNRPYFHYQNHSVPKDNPVHTSGTDIELAYAIRQIMQPCNIVLVVAGVYATHRKWIRAEIDMAKAGFWPPKPVLGVRPRASMKISAYVREHADAIVGWNTESVVSAIRRLAAS